MSDLKSRIAERRAKYQLDLETLEGTKLCVDPAYDAEIIRITSRIAELKTQLNEAKTIRDQRIRELHKEYEATTMLESLAYHETVHRLHAAEAQLRRTVFLTTADATFEVNADIRAACLPAIDTAIERLTKAAWKKFENATQPADAQRATKTEQEHTEHNSRVQPLETELEALYAEWDRLESAHLERESEMHEACRAKLKAELDADLAKLAAE